jgi:hypothetical protein
VLPRPVEPAANCGHWTHAACRRSRASQISLILTFAIFRRIDSRGVAFEQCKVGAFPRLQAANDVIHAALPGSIDCHGPERCLDRNALVSKKYAASFVHDASDGIRDITRWLKRRNVPA